LVLELFRFNGVLVFVGDRMTKALGLSTARWQTLGAMAMEEKLLTVAEIARAMGLQRQSVQRTVNDLIRTGMVTTRENPNHQRARLISFTAKGRAAFESTVALQIEWSNETAAALPAAQLSAVLKSLRTLRANLESAKTTAN
jgi:DNA-binding MarR family transcriptional regulator